MTHRGTILRWLSAWGVVPLLTLGVASLPATTTLADTTYTVYSSPVSSVDGSEILDITPNNKFAMVVGTNDDVNGGTKDYKLRAVTIATTGCCVSQSFDIKAALGASLGMTEPSASSVAIHPTDNYAIVTLREFSAVSGNAGKAIFIDVNPDTGAMSLRPGTTALTLGVHPESIDIAPNGSYAVVANEDPREGPAGSISIIDLRAGSPTRYQVVDTITPVIPAEGDTRFPEDPAPETVAISPNSTRAFVTLQPNNALTIIDVDPTTLQGTHTTQGLGVATGTTLKLRPDGLAVTPDGRHLITANEGGGGDVSKTVSLWRINPERSVTKVGDYSTPNAATPEMVDVGVVGGVLKAFVTSEDTDAVIVYTIADSGLTLDREVALNREGQPEARDPEGVKFANPAGLELIVTANVATQNVSVIRATTTTPPPPEQKVYLPMVLNQR